MNRSEHLQWCKDRSFEYLDSGDISQALASFISDMGEHPETEGHLALDLGMILLISGNLSDVPKMRKFIEDFN